MRTAATPKITISTTRVIVPGHVFVKGSGFTPKHTISSHLLKPSGDEYPVIPIMADEHGNFTHDIESLLLPFGFNELWAVDEASHTSSNHVRFDVEPS